MVMKNKSSNIIAFHYETYSEDSNLEKQIKNVLSSILEQFGCGILVMPIFTCLSEMLGNAIRANFKNIYFENYTPKNNAMDLIPYNVALQLFKMEFAANTGTFHSIARERSIKASIIMSIEKNILNIEVTNPMPLSDIEKNNINRKIEDSRKINNLNQYFREIADDPKREGAGLGIIFITMMLRSLGLPDDSLKIEIKNGKTVAEIAVPLTKTTVENYNRNLKEKNDF
ncbi:MAG: hypothetical protein JW982_07285 [Spirochaetes bacterium]|nr:hypothetical protein [Spirochaetota bacterium]